MAVPISYTPFVEDVYHEPCIPYHLILFTILSSFFLPLCLWEVYSCMAHRTVTLILLASTERVTE